MRLFNQDNDGFGGCSVSPFHELGAYEALWDHQGASFKTLAQRFAANPGALPSDFAAATKAQKYSEKVDQALRRVGIENYGGRLRETCEYPMALRDAQYPVELLYYQGHWQWMHAPVKVAVVGSRKPTVAGIARTKKLVRALVKDEIVVVSGLAAGIDTVAHQTAIAEGGQTIAVLGVPLSRFYPKQNAELQKQLALDHLVISQVPVMRYEKTGNPTANRFFFPERNITMSAITDATVIVEASDTSGTLVQAQAALKQNRKLFILESCLNNPDISWPRQYVEKGAIAVTDYEDIRRGLPSKDIEN